MKSTEVRQKFLDFAKDNGHAIIPSAPVVPEHDPTTLFNIAGMQPLVPYLLGEPHPAGKRLANVQKSIRTIDIDEVGDNSHATFMEMLGWWSLGDYFKEQTIEQTWELFTKVYGLPVDRLAATVFEGDDNAPRDKESAKIWERLGMPKARIFYRDAEENWWGPAGQTGPCGPSTEIFYWAGEGKPSKDIDHEGWLELGNNVLMHYEKTAGGKFVPIAQQNVDTGLGFERIVGALQGASSVYETDLYADIIAVIKRLANTKHQDRIDTDPELVRAVRIIADHVKAATFIIADGVRPSNTDRGYILRRLIRRAIRQARHLDIGYPFTETVAETVVNAFKEPYPELGRAAKPIREELLKEEANFSKTLDRGLKELGQVQQLEKIRGQDLFYYFETYGLPYEVIIEELKHKSTTSIFQKRLGYQEKLKEEFDEAFKAHQEKSRAGGAQKFAGGLADHSERVVRQHTATHLLLAALRDVLGDEVKQRGSNITKERLRFDFSHPEKLTEEQLNQVEALVNEKIKEDLPVRREEMPKENAEKLGAQAEFGHKYPDTVSVYLIGDAGKEFSIEFCGGPHVEHTGQIGTFKITKQESVGAGVRRLKAVVE